jgi:hypothetical protein
MYYRLLGRLAVSASSLRPGAVMPGAFAIPITARPKASAAPRTH